MNHPSRISLTASVLVCVALGAGAGCQTTAAAGGVAGTSSSSDRVAGAAADRQAAAGIGAAAATDADGAAVGDDAMPGRAVVYFGFDASSLDASPPALAELQRIAAYLIRHPGARLVISGHADERGTAEYNLALGQARATAARDYLVRLGVRVEQVRTTSFGEERPAVAGTGEAAWSQNRRGELVVVNNDA
jgi:peptidoglycan-associated lipoprotein